MPPVSIWQRTDDDCAVAAGAGSLGSLMITCIYPADGNHKFISVRQRLGCAHSDSGSCACPGAILQRQHQLKLQRQADADACAATVAECWTSPTALNHFTAVLSDVPSCSHLQPSMGCSQCWQLHISDCAARSSLPHYPSSPHLIPWDQAAVARSRQLHWPWRQQSLRAGNPAIGKAHCSGDCRHQQQHPEL
jgi:hypothetical protein